MGTTGTRRTGVVMAAAAVAIAFAATMIAMWSFAHERPAWGGYNLAIALLALGVVVAIRARRHNV